MYAPLYKGVRGCFIYSGMQHTSLVLDSTTDLSDGIMGLEEEVLENLLGRFDVVDINGVTVFQNHGAGCWCEKGMTGVRASTNFKTCRLLPKTSGN